MQHGLLPPVHVLVVMQCSAITLLAQSLHAHTSATWLHVLVMSSCGDPVWAVAC